MSVRTLCKDERTLRKLLQHQLFIAATLPFIVSALQASTGMVDSASQAEDILEDDRGIRHTCTTAAGRKRGPSETAEQTEVHLPGD